MAMKSQIMKYKLSHFVFNLPEVRKAKTPAKNRDESKLMVLHRESGKIEHKKFKDIVDYFDEGDVIVLNNTKVFPARLFGNKEKTGARIEVFLLRELNKETRLFDVLVDPARKIRIGNKSIFWEENKAFSFYDSVEHEVDNDSDELRLLLIFDVWSEDIPVSIKEYLKKDSAILKYAIVS